MAKVPFEAVTTEEAPAQRERKLKAAMEWLAGQLADGQAHVAGGLIIRGVEAGHAERTLQRASKLLKVRKTETFDVRGRHDSVLWEQAGEPVAARRRTPRAN